MNLGSNQAKKKTCSMTMLLLMLSITIPITFISTAEAHTPPWNIPTYAYLAISPNPIGVGEQVLVVFWISQPPATATGTSGGRWQNMQIAVAKPDGTRQTLGPFISDPVGGAYTLYTPDQVGTYSFTFQFPEQKLSLYNPENGLPGSNSAYVNDTYLASSATATLTVQKDSIPPPIMYPLPTEYWARPIEGQNVLWSTLGSHWLGGAQLGGYIDLWQKDGIAPNSPHIMWRKSIELGGIVGGTTGVDNTGFYSGGAYEGRMVNAMVIAGNLYFQLPLNHADGQRASGAGYICINLRTGQTNWINEQLGVPYIGTFDSNARPTIKGQLYDYESMNQHGVVAGTIWEVRGTTWLAYDAYTGKWIYNLTNVPNGFEVYTKQGEIVRYVLNFNAASRSGWLALWNNTAEHQGLQGGTGYDTNANQWRPMGKSVDMSKAYTWNVSVSADLTGNSLPTIIRVIPGDIIIGRSSSFTRTAGTPDPYTLWAISDKPESRGQLLWKQSYPAPSGNISRQLPDGVPVDTVNRVLFMSDTETMQWLGYSLDTGKLLWGPVGSGFRAYQYYGGGYGGGQEGFPAYGNLYTQTYGGEIHCYSGKDGKLLWKYNNTNSGTETPWGLRPIFIAAIADGKVYAFNNEHSPNYPLYRGQRVYCINATDGKEIWTIESWAGQIGGPGTSSAVLADGYLAYYNYYDNSVYSIGKGPSATTVVAPPIAVPQGTSILVQGTVTDESLGTKGEQQVARFPHGVPAVSDASMGSWMEYVYMQKPKPTNVTGVKVHLTATDPNGNWQDIGTATSDDLGNYALSWTPPVPGMYKVNAKFEGSESYYPSEAGASFLISKSTPVTPITIPTPTPSQTDAPSPFPTLTAAPTPSPAIPPTASEPTATYGAIGLVIVIIVVAAAALVIKRRK